MSKRKKKEGVLRYLPKANDTTDYDAINDEPVNRIENYKEWFNTPFVNEKGDIVFSGGATWDMYAIPLDIKETDKTNEP